MYLGTGTWGEKIGEIDYTSAWRQGDMWTPRTITINLLRTLEPGKYTFFVKWSGGTEEVTKMYLY